MRLCEDRSDYCVVLCRLVRGKADRKRGRAGLEMVAERNSRNSVDERRTARERAAILGDHPPLLPLLASPSVPSSHSCLLRICFRSPLFVALSTSLALTIVVGRNTEHAGRPAGRPVCLNLCLHHYRTATIVDSSIGPLPLLFLFSLPLCYPSVTPLCIVGTKSLPLAINHREKPLGEERGVVRPCRLRHTSTSEI